MNMNMNTDKNKQPGSLSPSVLYSLPFVPSSVVVVAVVAARRSLPSAVRPFPFLGRVGGNRSIAENDGLDRYIG